MKNSNFAYFLKSIKQPFVIIVVGTPLVGKSTAIKKWLASYDGNVKVISRDAIILEEAGTDDYSYAFKNVNQKEIDKLLISEFRNANLNKNNVIIDMTNLSPKRRKYNLSFFDDDYNKLAVIFTPLKMEELFSRNIKRYNEENKFIPEDVIVNMLKSFVPIKDSEGFDKVYVYEDNR